MAALAPARRSRRPTGTPPHGIARYPRPTLDGLSSAADQPPASGLSGPGSRQPEQSRPATGRHARTGRGGTAPPHQRPSRTSEVPRKAGRSRAEQRSAGVVRGEARTKPSRSRTWQGAKRPVSAGATVSTTHPGTTKSCKPSAKTPGRTPPPAKRPRIRKRPGTSRVAVTDGGLYMSGGRSAQRAMLRRDIERHRSPLGRICSMSSRSHAFSTSTPAVSHALRATSVPSAANWSVHSPSSPTRTMRAPRLPTYSMTALAPPWPTANDLMSAVSVVSEPSAMTRSLGRVRPGASTPSAIL